MSGWKTYAAAAVLAVVAVLHILGVNVPGFENVDSGVLLTNALGLFGIRWKLGHTA
jgi:hypothetical protein